MSFLEINLRKIRQNTANLKKALANIELVGVTKACAGDARVSKSIVEGGAEVIADSRIENLAVLVDDVPVKKMLLRAPINGAAYNALEQIDFIIASNLNELDRLNKYYQGKCRIGLILNIETGFKREGFDPSKIKLALDKVAEMGNSYYLSGFSTNTACRNGPNPLSQLYGFTKIIDPFINSPLPTTHSPLIISGGNSSVLPWALNKKLPEEVNQLRIGEAILLGHDTVNYEPIVSNSTDAFIIEAEVVQQNRYQGRRQAILALGYQDIGTGRLKPLGSVIKKIDDMYSEYCKVDLIDNAEPGKIVRFTPDYYALLALMTSPYVKKVYKNFK